MAGVFAIGGLAIAQIPAQQAAATTFTLAATDGADSADFTVTVAINFTLAATEGADNADFTVVVVPVPIPPVPSEVGGSPGKGLDLSSEHRELMRWGLGRRRLDKDEREASEDIRWELEKAIDPKAKPDGMDPRVWALLQSARNPDQAQFAALVKQVDEEDEDDIEAILALLP